MIDFERFKLWANSEIDCPLEEHPECAGPNMDIGQRGFCGMPMGVLRPMGESFGWHIDDCSLDFAHTGRCVGGGDGHTLPKGWKIRG